MNKHVGGDEARVNDSLSTNYCGFMFMYDITSQASFDVMPEVMDKLLVAQNGKKPPVMLVGHKVWSGCVLSLTARTHECFPSV